MKIVRSANELKATLLDYLSTAVSIMSGELSFLIGDGKPVIHVIDAAGL
jgi:hypothetical protein